MQIRVKKQKKMIEKNAIWEKKVSNIRHKNYLIDPLDYSEINFQSIENKSRKITIDNPSPLKQNLMQKDDDKVTSKTILELPLPQDHMSGFKIDRSQLEYFQKASRIVSKLERSQLHRNLQLDQVKQRLHENSESLKEHRIKHKEN